jgi:hypothetical protein
MPGSYARFIVGKCLPAENSSPDSESPLVNALTLIASFFSFPYYSSSYHARIESSQFSKNIYIHYIHLIKGYYMKKYLFFLIVLFVSVNISMGQTRLVFGLDGGTAIPTGSLKNENGIGVIGGASVAIYFSDPHYSIVLGADYAKFSDKTNTAAQITYTGSHFTSYYIGPRFGEETGVYIEPMVFSANIFSEGTRYGLAFGAGFAYPLNPLKLSLNAKYGVLNSAGSSNASSSEQLKSGATVTLGVECNIL